jgi:hypothetical protein
MKLTNTSTFKPPLFKSKLASPNRFNSANDTPRLRSGYESRIWNQVNGEMVIVKSSIKRDSAP